MRLESIRIYPVKSAGALAVARSEVEPQGLRHDRRWMAVDADGRFLTRRVEPGLARVQVVDARETWRLEVAGSGHVDLPKEIRSGRRREVRIWGDRVRATDGAPEASAWLSRVLGRELRLVYLGDPEMRRVDPDHAREGDVVSFADGYPLLLVNGASVGEVSRLAGREIADSRFRPNLVVTGAPPFAEDGWASIRVGEVTFAVARSCARCVVVDQDPLSGLPDRGVLGTLGTFRTALGKVFFGENLIPRSAGVVRTGDPVSVLARRDGSPVIMTP